MTLTLIQKQVLTAALTLLVSSMAFAKVGDFNTLIVENAKAQTELHQNLKQDLDSARIAAQNTNGERSEEKYIVDNSTSAINVPTTKSLLTFQKEKKYYRASELQKQKRLAEELIEAQ